MITTHNVLDDSGDHNEDDDYDHVATNVHVLVSLGITSHSSNIRMPMYAADGCPCVG